MFDPLSVRKFVVAAALACSLALAARKGKVGEPLPEGTKVETLEGDCPGAAGRVRFRYGEREDLSDARSTDWAKVGPERDFAHQFRLTGLKPATVYHYAAETAGPGGDPMHAPLRGRFETAPRSTDRADVTFTVVTGQAFRGTSPFTWRCLATGKRTITIPCRMTAGQPRTRPSCCP
jgi:hypothetical protein